MTIRIEDEREWSTYVQSSLEPLGNNEMRIMVDASVSCDDESYTKHAEIKLRAAVSWEDLEATRQRLETYAVLQLRDELQARHDESGKALEAWQQFADEDGHLLREWRGDLLRQYHARVANAPPDQDSDIRPAVGFSP